MLASQEASILGKDYLAGAEPLLYNGGVGLLGSLRAALKWCSPYSDPELSQHYFPSNPR